MQVQRLDTMAPVGCLGEEEISLYLGGNGGEVVKTRIFAHVDQCSDCRELLAMLARSDDTPGTEESASGPRVGRFILRKVLGEGAMGIVYLAYDPQLKRHVAVKLLRPDAEDESADDRLIIEAQTAAQLSHPNAVVVYDAGNHAGQPYVAMEYVEGMNAAQWLRRGGVSWQDAVAMMLDAGEGLAAAHRAGLVHRDFKPANVLLGEDGQVKVTDFGLAQFNELAEMTIAAHEEALNITRSDLRLNETGLFVGTPAYTSPEQFVGQAATAASDQYAFSVTLYLAVYGRRPFRGKTPFELYRKVIDSEPPPPPSDSRIPVSLWAVISQGLAKDPQARFESMDAMLAALRNAIGTESTSTRIVSGDHCPFPGLAAFGEDDAGLFFGRDRELTELLNRIRESGTACVVGSSGAGKSSFVRAMAIPRLREDQPMTELLWLRPGGKPFEALARLVAPLTTGESQFQPDELADWLMRDSTRLAGMLLARSRHYNTPIVLYVDQLEELYAQVQNSGERLAFAECIAAVGADPNRPLRLIASLRSDFLDRAGESAALMERITSGFLFLAPPGRESLIEAFTGPLQAVGYRLEDAAIATQLADELGGKPGAFPLLQFVAGRLWEDRDKERRVIMRQSLESMGALAGALATHADMVLSRLTNNGYRLARAVLLRLVTPEGTKRAVPLDELSEPTSSSQESKDSSELNKVIELLVNGRLLIAERRMESESPTIELVHETLISAWPTLRRWFEDQTGDAALVGDIRFAARRWESTGRSDGLLWRGAQADQVATLLHRNVNLTSSELAFSNAVVRARTRAARRRRVAFGLVFAVLLAVSAGATSAFLIVRQAEAKAVKSADAAKRDAQRAREARAVAAEALSDYQAAEKSEREAQDRANKERTKVVDRDAKSVVADQELRRALKLAESARRVAETARAAAESNARQLEIEKAKLAQRYKREKLAREQAERKAKKISAPPL